MENCLPKENKEIGKQWVVYPKESKSAWEVNSKGYIVQTKPIGTKRKNGSGTILISPESVGMETSSIFLDLSPGSEYSVGMVINFIDFANYIFYTVNQKGKSSGKYDIVIGEIIQGKYSRVLLEKVNEPINESITLSVIENDEILEFHYDGEVIYRWEDQQLNGQWKYGLYSQMNTDAEFIKLCLSDKTIKTYQEEASLDTSIPVEPALESAPIATGLKKESISKYLADSNGSLAHFLTTNNPEGKTLVDFQEVFSCPLDSFYASLYNLKEFNRSDSQAVQQSFRYKLDYRPRRWYREFNIIQKAIQFSYEDKNRNELLHTLAQDELSKILEKTRTDGEFPDMTIIDTQVERVQSLRDNIIQITAWLDELRRQEHQITSEINSNGYEVVTNNLSQIENETDPILSSIIKEYGFYIACSTSDDISFESIDTSNYPNLLKEETNGAKSDWRKFVGALGNVLNTIKGSLPPFILNQFASEADKLNTWEESPGVIQQKANLENQLLSEQAYLKLLKKQRSDLIDKKSVINNELANEMQADHNTYYNIMIVKGKSDNKRYLSTVEYGQTVDMFVRDDGSGRQKWKLVEIPGTNFYNIKIADGKSDNFKFLSTDLKAKVNMWHQDDKTGRQRWERVKIGENLYNIKISGGKYFPYKNHKFLSTVESGALVDMFTEDDGSGRQGWKLEKKQMLSELALELQGVISDLENQITNKNQEISASKQQINTCQLELDELSEEKLLEKDRNLFIDKWNNHQNLTDAIGTSKPINPHQDPLSEFLKTVQISKNRNIQVSIFKFNSDGLYSEEGLSINDYLKLLELNPPMTTPVAILPTFDDRGDISDEILTVIINPQRYINLIKKRPLVPRIKFVETYQIAITWNGYCLGELSHTVNLFPGESKELFIEKQTKITKKIAESVNTEEVAVRKTTSSFETNVENAFSLEAKASDSMRSKEQRKASSDLTNDIAAAREEKSSFNWDVRASAKFGPVSASGGVGGGISSGSNWSEKRSEALRTSLDVDNERSSNQSKDTLQKNVSNVIKKTANDTSINNKLEITATTSEELDKSLCERETIHLENPNIGRTINYNFFQLQNVYQISTRLIDVKLVIDPGYEIIKDSNVHDIRVFELEDFGKFHANADQSEPRLALLAGFVSRQIFKHYGDFAPGITSGNGAISVSNGTPVDAEMMKILNFSSESSGSSDNENNLYQNLLTALRYLRSIPFKFNEVELQGAYNVTVNAGAYYLDSEVGKKAATEEYLEKRREIEIGQQQAEVDYLKGQTSAGRFFPNIPEKVTHLNLGQKTLIGEWESKDDGKQ